jgi:glycosyltransferase involved in cell wall biosynthesis
MRVGLVVPHIFMQAEILPKVIFSPGKLAIELAEGLQALGAEVTLFSPGAVHTKVKNETADLSFFEKELKARDDTYIDLLKKHPLTFVSLARQVQAELIAKAFAAANNDELDVVHIYTNEEDIALPFAQFCQKPVVFTHHDPFSFLVKYKNVFPKYKHLNWISMSYAQRKGMPADTNWVANIYHGLDEHKFKPNYSPKGRYLAYLGRIIEPKGLHLAIEAVKHYNASVPPEKRYVLKIAGKHYAGHKKDTYWQTRVKPHIDGKEIEYLGFLASDNEKQTFLGNASVLLIPSIFEEPFGMVALEALACATPVIGLDSGAIPEVIQPGAGVVIQKVWSTPAKLDEALTSQNLASAIPRLAALDRKTCRRLFEGCFTLGEMTRSHLQTYQQLCDHGQAS